MAVTFLPFPTWWGGGARGGEEMRNHVRRKEGERTECAAFDVQRECEYGECRGICASLTLRLIPRVLVRSCAG